MDLKIEDNQLMATTRYPNTCLEPWITHKVSENKYIVLLHFAEQFDETICTRSTRFKDFAFDLSGLEESEYKIVDGFDSKIIGTISIDDDETFLETSL